MNKNKLKAYAPAARRAFIQAVTDRAHYWGLSESGSEPIEEKGDIAIIGGRPFPIKVAAQRRGLEEHIRREGFFHVMEEVAYTWFNRFMAIRYMEIHGYLEHGFRVLSNPTGSPIPEILEKAAQVDLTGLDKQKVIELKLDGTKDAELYRLLLIAQCNALHDAMPFLFEKINDATELLLPDNLLHSDSLISKLVSEIDEEDWQEVEIVGWLYQFYISEKKDQVIGKVVKSEDIPAATQLFTPNWIVKYMVQNSLGRMWLATYPNSPLRAKMEYYIEPAEQTDEVNAQLKAITPDTLNPESLTFLDPAKGSGHILVEAYDIFKEIYLERGYSSRDFPRLILEKNLYGLDIDDRAAQMAGFALLMKARKDDRRILQNGNPPKLNVMAIQGSEGLDAKEIAGYLLDKVTTEVRKQDIAELVELFRHGKTFGSLITVPEGLAEKLPALSEIVEAKLRGGDMFARQSAEAILPFVDQAKIMAGIYDCVVANPPYMGKGGMNSLLKHFARNHFPSSKSDLFAMFIERGFCWSGTTGFNSMVTMQSWMFLSSFEEMREMLLTDRTIITMAHLGARAFGEIAGEVVQTTTFIMQVHHINGYRPVFFRLVEGQEEQKQMALLGRENRFDKTIQDNFKKITGSPLAYWVGEATRNAFANIESFDKYAHCIQGIITGNTEQFIRYWYEVNRDRIAFNKGCMSEINIELTHWIPYTKGGQPRKWYGNNEHIINWKNKGEDLVRSRTINADLYLRPCITWTLIGSTSFAARYCPDGYLWDVSGSIGFPRKEKDTLLLLALLCSRIAKHAILTLNPTINTNVEDVNAIPLIIPIDSIFSRINETTKTAITISMMDWNSWEYSWDFKYLPFFEAPFKQSTIAFSWHKWQIYQLSQVKRMQELETENNRIFIEAYGLQDELTPDVPEDQITLARADREADMKRLISYAIGCMMGRYSLDQPGLVYANSGNIGFDHAKYKSFPADDDGIVPVMDMEWFEDDAACRFEHFLKVAWPPETLEENLKFVADSLSPKSGETPRDTIRRYISTQFFKDHMQTYKKRPIYWLFSSGKQRAFECLVYLHRYNEATLSRMRNEYVTPLQGKFSARADFLTHEIDAAATTSARSKLQKQLDVLKKKQTELSVFDDLLRHYADQRIHLDLDDGVKVNYGKFGNLLAEVRTITGGSEG